ncbi:MAG: hypothetical protein KatS3mg096_815 [Candidatus Parcubacteria bacterium]|nr:MAG: hypothetical protein KatS3mg096_815 [Candidatus Parcubacteria bacterium]
MIKKNLKDQFYTLEEIAKILKVSYLTVYRWVKTGKLLSFKAGKQYRIKKENLDDFIKKYE